MGGLFKRVLKIFLIFVSFAHQIFIDFRRSFFQILSHFAIDENEQDKLKEFGSPEGTEERYSYANRPRRTILEVLQVSTRNYASAEPAFQEKSAIIKIFKSLG